MNIRVQVFGKLVSIIWGIYLGVELLDHIVTLLYSPVETGYTILDYNHFKHEDTEAQRSEITQWRLLT